MMIFIINKLTGFESGEQFHNAIKSSWALFLWTRGVNAVVPIAAGYFAAKIARRGERINGALSSFLYVGAGIYLLAYPQFPEDWAANAIATAAAPFLGMLGGALRKTTSRVAQETPSR
jgi:hypothetical protein